MNPLLQFLTKLPYKLERPFGSERFYARLSQTETVPAPEKGGSRATWLFEAFDAQWFDEHLESFEESTWTAFYDTARLFVLEMHISISQLHRFDAFRTIHESDSEGNEPEDWFSIAVNPLVGRELAEGELPITIYPNLYLPGVPAGVTNIQPTDPNVSVRLKKAVSTSHIADATEAEIDQTLAGVRSVKWAVVYDVGQGNAVGLCNSHGSVEAYFDFGGGVLANSHTFPVALRRFCFTARPPIILSHWDFDHWSSANRDPQALSATWVAPRQSVGPTHVALMASIVASGKLLLVPAGFQQKWRQHTYLELCTGSGRNHSGLALTLAEQPGGSGQHMLFPGDARYSSIASFSTSNSYASVVAPHHGADMKNYTTPTCPGRQHSRLVYSYGAGNTFNHPRPVTRAHHHAAGWHDPHVTTGLPAYEARETPVRTPFPLGHVLLGWAIHSAPPALPCNPSSSKACQLQAQQL